jgi:hypothetical protein
MKTTYTPRHVPCSLLSRLPLSIENRLLAVNNEKQRRLHVLMHASSHTPVGWNGARYVPIVPYQW